MTLAALVVAVSFATTAHERLLEFLSRLLRRDAPFAAAPRLAGRAFSRTTRDGLWRRYEGDDCFIELGPFVGNTPQKVVITARFSTRVEAVAFIARVSSTIPSSRVPRPSFSIQADGPFSYRGTVILDGRPIGLEIDLDHDEENWNVTAAWIQGGPRTVVPIE